MVINITRDGFECSSSVGSVTYFVSQTMVNMVTEDTLFFKMNEIVNVLFYVRLCFR